MRHARVIIVSIIALFLTLVEVQAGGAFTVNSSGGRVEFQAGNLVLSTADYQWSFQESSLGQEENVIGGAPSSVVDLFGWSGSTYPYWGVSALEAAAVYGGTFRDWSEAVTSDEEYKTLSAEEWEYILYERANAATLKEYQSGSWVIKSDDGTESVTLPIAGARKGGQSVDMSYGAYWTSTAVGTDSAKCLILTADTMMIATKARALGASVRLAKLSSVTVTVDYDPACENFMGWSDDASDMRTERTFGSGEALAEPIIEAKNLTLKGATNDVTMGQVQITIVQRNE